MHNFKEFLDYCESFYSPSHPDVLYPIDGDELVRKYGGPLNVYVDSPDHVKFRRKRDAVIFSLRNF